MAFIQAMYLEPCKDYAALEPKTHFYSPVSAFTWHSMALLMRVKNGYLHYSLDPPSIGLVALLIFTSDER